MRTVVVTWMLAIACLLFAAERRSHAQTTIPPLVPTTLTDFFQPGTQPLTITDPLFAATGCGFCHANYDPDHAIVDTWRPSIMAQAGRDPLFYACLAIAEQDAAFVGDLCLRCHSPVGWLGGRSEPTDGSALDGFQGDLDGITCHVCHRMVDPIPGAGNPVEDAGILAALPNAPTSIHSGQYVMDPLDRRRGPFTLPANFAFHEWRMSPFHREALLCATCHDVSNPVFTRSGDDYVVNDLNAPHPTHDKTQEFPIERTYSEWSMSAFAVAPIDMGGRFGGNLSAVSTCQDCHMPDVTARGCGLSGPVRTDMPRHEFSGSHTWILDSILNLDVTLELYDVPSFLSQAMVDAAKSNNISMLERASDVELTRVGTDLQVRVINQTGHKLPSGYPEGRRIWVNVRFYDASGTLVREHGAYDWAEADLDAASTKVYETKLGLDAAMAATTGLPAGESFHFALNNKIYKDNRIPPRGFTNSGFQAVQASPVAYSYADGQYWDDSLFPIPVAATDVEVAVYYQTASKEYITFLRDQNITNNAGEVLYNQWLATGKGPPVRIDIEVLALPPADFVRTDCDGNGQLDLADVIRTLELLFQAGAPESLCPDACDGNDDGRIDIADAVATLLGLFLGAPVPSPYPNCGSDPGIDSLGCLTGGCP
ncbi:MAG: hypothetical protein AB7O52_12685 [Planctomycetota bacterium]